jgi:hypothetical protein
MSVGGFEGQTINFTIAMNSSNGQYGYSNYIDWNNDFTFGTAEKVYGTTAQGVSPFSNSFSVPSGHAVGQYRMRVIGDWIDPSPGPCGSTYSEAEDYTFDVTASPNCLPPTALVVSNGTPTTIDFGWTEMNSANAWEVEYGPYGYPQGSGTSVSVTTSNSYTMNITAGVEYDFYVRSICSAGSSSNWAGPYEFRYCDVSITYQGDHLTDVNSIGALVDLSYSTTTYPAGGYVDETAQLFTSYEGQTFDITTEYMGGGNGVNIWVDWNLNNVFEASEVVATLADANPSKTLSVKIPIGTALGEYRMRIRSENGATANPSPCGSVLFGSAIDFNLTIDLDPGFVCAIPTDVIAVNITGTTLDLSWTENGAATLWNMD